MLKKSGQSLGRESKGCEVAVEAAVGTEKGPGACLTLESVSWQTAGAERVGEPQ